MIPLRIQGEELIFPAWVMPLHEDLDFSLIAGQPLLLDTGATFRFQMTEDGRPNMGLQLFLNGRKYTFQWLEDPRTKDPKPAVMSTAAVPDREILPEEFEPLIRSDSLLCSLRSWAYFAAKGNTRLS
jgi:hypothetical protein